MKKILLALILSLFLSAPVPAQDILTLKNFLSEVEKKNHELISASFAIEAMGKKMKELDMAYSPFASLDASYIIDKSGAGFGSTLPTKEMRAGTLDAAVSQKWPSGSNLSAGLTANAASFDLYYPTRILSSDLLSNFAGYELKPFIRFDQSLLKDLFNGQTQSGINKTKSAIKAAQYMQLFAKQQIVLKAKAAYLSFSLAKEVVQFRQTSLERSKKLLDWTEKRYKVDLADKSDYLQAQAAYKLRQLNLQMAAEDEVKACSDFNELTGSNCASSEYTLEKVSDLTQVYGLTDKLKRNGKRADTYAANENYASSSFAQKEAFRRSGAEVGVYGMVALHGLELSLSEAFKQLYNAEKPMFVFGINYTTTLDFSKVFETRKGYELDMHSAFESLNKTEVSADNDWEELTRNWENVKSRLALAQDIKDIQEKRVNAEQEKFQRGRTTTNNVLNAENDLDDASLNVYRLTMEELLTAAQAELYNTQPIE
jgi:outer membrane protein TolC